MLLAALKGLSYGSIILSLFLIDYVLGNGLLNIFQNALCKIICFVKRTLKEEVEKAVPVMENPINMSVLMTEIVLLTLTITILHKYKQYRSKDRIDELLQESKDALKQTNEFLEKWRLRRINWQVPTECTYLDDEPQEIKPLKLEVPILHMAIIDTLGSTRSQLERGDAGDTITITNSTLLSVTSLLEDEEINSTHSEERINTKNVEFHNNRCLWNVMEEDANVLEEDQSVVM